MVTAGRTTRFAKLSSTEPRSRSSGAQRARMLAAAFPKITHAWPWPTSKAPHREGTSPDRSLPRSPNSSSCSPNADARPVCHRRGAATRSKRHPRLAVSCGLNPLMVPIEEATASFVNKTRNTSTTTVSCAVFAESCPARFLDSASAEHAVATKTRRGARISSGALNGHELFAVCRGGKLRARRALASTAELGTAALGKLADPSSRPAFAGS